MVMNTPGGNTISTAQLALSLLASMARKIPQADSSVKTVSVSYIMAALAAFRCASASHSHFL